MNYKIGICAMLMLFLSACKNNQSDAEIEKAKAIVWVDKHGEKDWKDYGMIRTAKARVYVYTDGTFRIISFCKKQEPEVVKYLKKRAAVYTIPKFFFDEGYLEPGEQYLQIRYIPSKVGK